MKKNKIGVFAVGLMVLGASRALSGEGAVDALPLDSDMVVDSTSSDTDSESVVQRSEPVPSAQKRENVRSPQTQDRSKLELPAGAVISNGERVEIDGKGFSIIAPQGWIVRKNLPRSSLFLQAQVPSSQYPRNISVVRFKGPKYITGASAQEYADRLVASYPQVSSTIEAYSLRSHEAIKMVDGREGWLFYTDFKDSGRKMMADILVSSETSHYLATYTDVAEHFEGSPSSDQFLAEAWSAMTSIELDSANPSTGFSLNVMIFVGLGVVLLLILANAIRKFFAKRHYRAVANADDPGEPISNGPDEVDQSMLKSEIRSSEGPSASPRIVQLKPRTLKATSDDDELIFTSQEKSTKLKRGA